MKKLINTWNGESSITLRFNEDGKIKETKVRPNWYFAIEKKDQPLCEKLLISRKVKLRPDTDSEFTKVYVDLDEGEEYRSKIVLHLEEKGIKTYEGDLNLDRRWYIDYKPELSETYTKLYFDIETDDSKAGIIAGRDRILSYAAINHLGKRFFYMIKEETDAEEKILIENFLKLAVQYDMLLGWNTKGFDIPYLQRRIKHLYVGKNVRVMKDENGDIVDDEKANQRVELTPAERRKLPHDSNVFSRVSRVDLLARMRHIYRFDSQIKKFSLDHIANHFLGKGKIKHEDKKIIDLYRTDKNLLKDYNIEDCILTKEIDEKLGISDMVIRMSLWTGVPVSKFGLYSIIDAFITRKAHEQKKYVRTSIPAIKERSVENLPGNDNADDTNNFKVSPDTEEAQYTGAVVLDAQIGLYSNVYVFDFKSLYPSVMRTSNIGWDTLRYEADESYIKNPGTYMFPRKVGDVKPTNFIKSPSVINLAITELLDKRTEYKNLKLKLIEDGKNSGPDWDRVVSDEIIVKELSNSTYGIMGLQYGRYFDVDIAESITLFGQWNLNNAKEFFEGRGYKVIYGDTDSVFVAAGDKGLNIREELDLFHIDLRERLKRDWNIDKCHIQLNFDKHHRTFLLVAKKTYVGHCINMEGKKVDQLYTRGLDFIKKNTFGYAAKLQEDLVKRILIKGITTEDIIGFVLKAKEDFYKKEFSKEDLTITQKIGKSFDSYKSKPLHVQLAQERHKKVGGMNRNVEVEFIVTGTEKGMKGILADEYTGEYDRDYYWFNKTLPVLERVTQPVIGEYDFFPEPKKEVKIKPVKIPRKKKGDTAVQLTLF